MVVMVMVVMVMVVVVVGLRLFEIPRVLPDFRPAYN